MTNSHKSFTTNPLGEGLNIYRHGGWKGQLVTFPVHHYYWGTIEAAFRDPDGFVFGFHCALLG